MTRIEQRRETILKYIVDRIGEGNSPTVREICQDLHIASTSTVHSDLHALAESGLIETTGHRNRTIRLPGSRHIRVPLLGTVAAGSPVLAVQNIEQFIPVSISAPGDKELFALRVKGNSMINAAILDGDIVVVERTPTAQNGQIVVAMAEDEATVKRFYKENGGYRLQPENDTMEPILLSKVEVLGVVYSVMRFY